MPVESPWLNKANIRVPGVIVHGGIDMLRANGDEDEEECTDDELYLQRHD